MIPPRWLLTVLLGIGVLPGNAAASIMFEFTGSFDFPVTSTVMAIVDFDPLQAPATVVTETLSTTAVFTETSAVVQRDGEIVGQGAARITQRQGIGLLSDFYGITATIKSLIGDPITLTLVISSTTTAFIGDVLKLISNPSVFQPITRTLFSLGDTTGTISSVSARIPEPWTLVLVMSGLAVLALVSRWMGLRIGASR